MQEIDNPWRGTGLPEAVLTGAPWPSVDANAVLGLLGGARRRLKRRWCLWQDSRQRSGPRMSAGAWGWAVSRRWARLM